MWSCKINKIRCKINQSKMLQQVPSVEGSDFGAEKPCTNHVGQRKPVNHLVATVLTSTATTAKAIDSTNTICWAWCFGEFCKVGSGWAPLVKPTNRWLKNISILNRVHTSAQSGAILVKLLVDESTSGGCHPKIPLERNRKCGSKFQNQAIF